jgi:hypothetical protein
MGAKLTTGRLLAIIAALLGLIFTNVDRRIEKLEAASQTHDRAVAITDTDVRNIKDALTRIEQKLDLQIRESHEAQRRR